MRPIDLRAGRWASWGWAGSAHSCPPAAGIRNAHPRLRSLRRPQRFTELGAAPVDYETLLQTSDVVTFHVPENAETFRLLNREAIVKLKPEQS